MVLKNILLVCMVYVCICISCHTGNANHSLQNKDSNASQAIIINPGNIPDERKDIKKDPVDSYKEKTDNPLNDWYFSR